jgi:hypothetical protein
MLTPKKPITVGLMTVTTRTVKTGGVTLENLRQTAEMDGIVSLENEDGEKILLDIAEDEIGQIVQTARVVKADRGILDKLSPPPAPKA